MRKLLLPALSLLTFFASCAPMLPIQSARIGKGMSITAAGYISPSTIDCRYREINPNDDGSLDTTNGSISEKQIIAPAGNLAFRIADRVELSGYYVPLLHGGIQAKVKCLDVGEGRMFHNLAASLYGGASFDGNLIYLLDRNSAYAGVIFGTRHIFSDKAELEWVISPTFEYQSVLLKSRNIPVGVTCHDRILSIPTGILMTIGTKGAFGLFAGITGKYVIRETREREPTSTQNEVSYRTTADSYTPAPFEACAGVTLSIGARKHHATLRSPHARKRHKKPSPSSFPIQQSSNYAGGGRELISPPPGL